MNYTAKNLAAAINESVATNSIVRVAMKGEDHKEEVFAALSSLAPKVALRGAIIRKKTAMPPSPLSCIRTPPMAAR
jgi:hypothetical protein